MILFFGNYIPFMGDKMFVEMYIFRNCKQCSQSRILKNGIVLPIVKLKSYETTLRSAHKKSRIKTFKNFLN